MIDDNRLAKVQILIHQKKLAEAEGILKGLLSEEPNDSDVLGMLAEVNLQRDNLDTAKSSIDYAIRISPDDPHLYFIKSRISIQQNHYDEAEEAIAQSIKFNPYDADYFALLAMIRLSRKQFESALEFANKALEIDAENLFALNTRSTALLKLNRSEESFDTIEGALREDPNNAYTHANYGWSLLEKGDHKKALVHFREALKSDPNFDYAQAGMVEALKAANPVYKLFLKYSFWMGNLAANYQWGFIIGFYIGVRILRSVANSYEALQPFLFPLIGLLFVFAFSTWVINPIGNLFLRFNVYGQVLLDKNEKKSSNLVAGSLVVCILGVLAYFLLSDERFLTVAAFGFAMMVPFGVMFAPSKNANALQIYALAMAVVGLLAIALTFTSGNLTNSMTIIFLLAFFGFQWVANYLMIKADNR